MSVPCRNARNKITPFGAGCLAAEVGETNIVQLSIVEQTRLTPRPGIESYSINIYETHGRQPFIMKRVRSGGNVRVNTDRCDPRRRSV